MPLLLCIAEGLALRRKDPALMTLARRWARSAVIIFAIGAVSGTIVEFELGLLWPTYIKFIGAVIGPLFGLCLLPGGHLLRYLPLWLGSSPAAYTLVVFLSYLDRWTGLGLVYRHDQCLDEYSRRL